MNTYFLAADIGGTNARLHLYDYQNSKYLKSEIYLTKNFKSLSALIHEFIDEYNDLCPSIDCYVAIAGSQVNNKIDRIANINWVHLDGNIIKEEFGFSFFKFINEFEAIGYAVRQLKNSDIVFLNEGVSNIGDDNLIKIVIGPGTGLGICQILDSKDNYRVLPSEGGHLMFSPISSYDSEFYTFYKKELSKNNHTCVKILTLEHAVGGLGIPYVYKFTYLQNKDKIGYDYNPEFTAKDILRKTDKLCKATQKYYVYLLSYCIYQFILAFAPKGGIYFMNPIILTAVKRIYKNDYNCFFKDVYDNLKIFCSNKVFSNLINHIPFYLIKAINLENIGVINYALVNKKIK